MEPFIRSFREPTYKETAQKTIETIFSDKTTPASADSVRFVRSQCVHSV
jgi:hypothetical protein